MSTAHKIKQRTASNQMNFSTLSNRLIRAVSISVAVAAFVWQIPTRKRGIRAAAKLERAANIVSKARDLHRAIHSLVHTY